MYRSNVPCNEPRNEAREEVPYGSIHDVNLATGSQPKARVFAYSDDEAGPGSLRAGLDYVHAYGLGQPVGTGHRSSEGLHRVVLW